MYRVLFTRNDQLFNEPYLTPLPPWQQDGDLEEIARQAIERLLMERQKRGNRPGTPNGYRIVNERDQVIKSERVF